MRTGILDFRAESLLLLFNVSLFLAARGLYCGEQASLVVEVGFGQYVGSQFPSPGSNPYPLHWRVDS